MLYYVWVITMALRYKFSSEEIAEIKAERRVNKDKRAETRLKALELRAEGMKSSEVAQATGFHAAYVTVSSGYRWKRVYGGI